MSQSSGKKESVKAKIERTAKGVKCMGLKSDSSQPSSVSKKAPKKMRSRNPTCKVYKSQVKNSKAPNVSILEDVSDEEEINAEGSPVNSPPDVVADVEATGPKGSSAQETSGKESTSHENSGDSTQPNISGSSSSKDADPASVQNISDDASDDVPLTETFADSVAARMKKKRRISSPEVTPTPSKKSRQASVKSKGKQKEEKTPTEKKKRKTPVEVEDSESDVEVGVQDIRSSEKKKFSGKRIPQNVPAVPIDRVSFHSEENVQKWKFVCKRRIAKEREVGSDVLKCRDVVALIEKAGLMKTIQNVGRCYEKLVREFLVNLSVDALLLKLQEEERQDGEHSNEEEGSEASAENSAEGSKEKFGSEA